MKKLIKAAVILAAAVMLTACSRSIDINTLLGTWEYSPEGGEKITITVTEDYFMQSSGGKDGQQLRYERTSDGLIIRNNDQKELIRLYYDENRDKISYTVKNSDGSDLTLSFNRK